MRLFRKTLLPAFLLLALGACTCKDGAMISGFDRGYKPCGMSCVDREGKDCRCTSRCPCWIVPASGGQRKHRTPEDKTPEDKP